MPNNRDKLSYGASELDAAQNAWNNIGEIGGVAQQDVGKVAVEALENEIEAASAETGEELTGDKLWSYVVHNLPQREGESEMDYLVRKMPVYRHEISDEQLAEYKAEIDAELARQATINEQPPEVTEIEEVIQTEPELEGQDEPELESEVVDVAGDAEVDADQVPEVTELKSDNQEPDTEVPDVTELKSDTNKVPDVTELKSDDETEAEQVEIEKWRKELKKPLEEYWQDLEDKYWVEYHGVTLGEMPKLNAIRDAATQYLGTAVMDEAARDVRVEATLRAALAEIAKKIAETKADAPSHKAPKGLSDEAVRQAYYDTQRWLRQAYKPGSSIQGEMQDADLGDTEVRMWHEIIDEGLDNIGTDQVIESMIPPYDRAGLIKSIRNWLRERSTSFNSKTAEVAEEAVTTELAATEEPVAAEVAEAKPILPLPEALERIRELQNVINTSYEEAQQYDEGNPAKKALVKNADEMKLNLLQMYSALEAQYKSLDLGKRWEEVVREKGGDVSRMTDEQKEECYSLWLLRGRGVLDGNSPLEEQLDQASRLVDLTQRNIHDGRVAKQMAKILQDNNKALEADIAIGNGETLLRNLWPAMRELNHEMRSKDGDVAEEVNEVPEVPEVTELVSESQD